MSARGSSLTSEASGQEEVDVHIRDINLYFFCFSLSDGQERRARVTREAPFAFIDSGEKYDGSVGE